MRYTLTLALTTVIALPLTAHAGDLFQDIKDYSMTKDATVGNWTGFVLKDSDGKNVLCGATTDDNTLILTLDADGWMIRQLNKMPVLIPGPTFPVTITVGRADLHVDMDVENPSTLRAAVTLEDLRPILIASAMGSRITLVERDEDGEGWRKSQSLTGSNQAFKDIVACGHDAGFVSINGQ